MSARDEILGALRVAAPEPVPLPRIAIDAIRYPDVRERFAKAIVEAGGRAAIVDGSLEDALLRIPEYAQGRFVASLVDGAGARKNVDVAAMPGPHAFADVDFCILGAELAVAESGAMWITNHGDRNRSVCFLTQHLAVVVRASTIVHNLHEAMERIALPHPGFAMFLSGPSKTADIEQALVIGAHGARSCTVLIV